MNKNMKQALMFAGAFIIARIIEESLANYGVVDLGDLALRPSGAA